MLAHGTEMDVRTRETRNSGLKQANNIKLKYPPNNTNALTNTYGAKINVLQKLHHSHQIDQTVALLSTSERSIAVTLREQKVRDQACRV
jgi:hypothetical protein